MTASYSQLVQWFTTLWQSPVFLEIVVPVATSVFALLGMLVLQKWFRLRHTPGMHYSPQSAKWASVHFPEFDPPIAAYVADLLREQPGMKWADLSREADLRADLLMSESELKDFTQALQSDLQISIPEGKAEAFTTIRHVVEYLEHRAPSAGSNSIHSRAVHSSC